MGIFDRFRNTSVVEPDSDEKPKLDERRTEHYILKSLPIVLEDLKTLPQADLLNPYKTAALTILALYAYSQEPKEGLAMLEFLKGSEIVTSEEKNFMEEYFEERPFAPMAYFKGSTPENDYTPTGDYRLDIYSNGKSNQEYGSMKVFIKCLGANNASKFVRLKKEGAQWYLVEHVLLCEMQGPDESALWL